MNWRTVNNGWENKLAFVLVVNGVDPDLTRRGGVMHCSIDGIIVRRGNHQPMTGNLLRLKIALQQHGFALCGPMLEIRFKLMGHHGQHRAGIQQRPRFTQSDMATAYQQHGFAG